MKVVKGILELDFVEMSEVTATANSPHVPSQPPPPPVRPAITDISQWAERFSLMAAIMTTRFPHKSLEFWAAHNVRIRMNELIIQNWEVIQRKFKLRGINFPNFKDDLLYGKLSEAIHHPHANYVFVRKSESKDAHYACRMTMEQQRAPSSPGSWNPSHGQRHQWDHSPSHPRVVKQPSRSHPGLKACRRFNEVRRSVCAWALPGHTSSATQGIH